MDDAALVRGLEASAIWRAIAIASSTGIGPLESRDASLAVDELERESDGPVDFLDAVDRRDVGWFREATS